MSFEFISGFIASSEENYVHISKTFKMLNKIIKYFLNNKLITSMLLVAILILGFVTAPLDWGEGNIIPRNPIPVDAIPDIGENQQIVATEWMGRSPKDIQEQITYPLTTYILGIPGVKTIRSTSM